MESTDFETWSLRSDANFLDLKFFAGNFIGLAREPSFSNEFSVKYSGDGLSWTDALPATSDDIPFSLVQGQDSGGGNLFLMGTQFSDTIRSSANGVVWSEATASNILEVPPFWDGSQFISAVNEQLATSADGITWNPLGQTYCSGCDFFALQVVAKDGVYVVGVEVFQGEGSSLGQIYSLDGGETWSSESVVDNSCGFNSRLDVVGDLFTLGCDTLYVSHNGVDWVKIYAPTNDPRLILTDSGYKLIGSRGAIMRSTE